MPKDEDVRKLAREVADRLESGNIHDLMSFVDRIRDSALRLLEERAAKSGDIPPLCQRIAIYLRRVWGGNVSRMARDLRVSHAGLTRVLGGQYPGGRLLEALSNRPEVSTYWLMVGEPKESKDAG